MPSIDEKADNDFEILKDLHKDRVLESIIRFAYVTEKGGSADCLPAYQNSNVVELQAKKIIEMISFLKLFSISSLVMRQSKC